MRRPSKLCVIACLGLGTAASLAARRTAGASEASFYVGLGYQVDDPARRCWDEATFRKNVAQWEGYDPFRPGESVTVSVRVGGSGRTLDGQIDWRNADGSGMGQRHFRATDGDCVALLKEMSFAVAFQIESLRPGKRAGAQRAPSEAVSGAPAGSAPSSSVTPPVPAAPSPPPETANPGATATSAAATRPPAVPEPVGATARLAPRAGAGSAVWPMWLGAGASLAWGVSPAVTGEASLFVGAQRRNLSLELGALASFPSTQQQWDLTGFRQTLIGAQASLCEHRGALSACLLGTAGEVRVSGLGVDQPRSPAAFVAQAGLRLAAAFRLGGRWSATSHLDVLGLITPYTVDLNQAAVWSMPRLGALAGIDVSARFR